MTFKRLVVDERDLTIEAVKFPNKEIWRYVKDSIEIEMCEGFIPSHDDVQAILDGILGKIGISEIVRYVQTGHY